MRGSAKGIRSFMYQKESWSIHRDSDSVHQHSLSIPEHNAFPNREMVTEAKLVNVNTNRYSDNIQPGPTSGSLGRMKYQNRLVQHPNA
jgi:hypothetical protein